MSARRASSTPTRSAHTCGVNDADTASRRCSCTGMSGYMGNTGYSCDGRNTSVMSIQACDVAAAMESARLTLRILNTLVLVTAGFEYAEAVRCLRGSSSLPSTSITMSAIARTRECLPSPWMYLSNILPALQAQHVPGKVAQPSPFVVVHLACSVQQLNEHFLTARKVSKHATSEQAIGTDTQLPSRTSHHLASDRGTCETRACRFPTGWPGTTASAACLLLPSHPPFAWLAS